MPFKGKINSPMKKFYATGLAVLFFALTTIVNGQNQKNEFTGISTEKSSLKSSTLYDLIRLRIENEFVFDATVIYYYETFSDDRGPEDSDKMFNSSEKIPEIFTRIGNSAMAINGFADLDNRSSITVPISVRNRVWNECKISANLEDFPAEYDVVLEDVETGQFINLRKSNYSYSPSVLGTVHDRFILHLSSSSKVATGISQEPQNNQNTIEFSSNYGQLNVHLNTEMTSKAKIDVYTLTGQKVVTRQASSGLNQIELAGGQIYIVSVIVGDQLTTKKVAIR